MYLYSTFQIYINGLSSADLITSKPFVMLILSIELKLLSNTMRRTEPHANRRIFRLLYYVYNISIIRIMRSR